ncbi:hypothetical protein LTR94_025162 [Friedmanniomyces endolithicus]|nr:hypothetical protein LTR94_025162 [Friedmanniomyces endolithicus]
MTDPTTPQSQPALDPALIARVKGILLQPKSEWARIDGEFATTNSLFTKYAMILAAVGPIANLLGGQLIAMGGVRVPIVGAIIVALFSYALSLGAVFIMGLVINALAPSFGGAPNKIQAMKVAVYSWTAFWLAGVFALVQPLIILSIVGLYSFYLLFVGLPVLMKVPEDKKLGYFAVVAVIGIVVYCIVAMILGGIAMSFTMGAQLAAMSSGY